MDLWTNRHQHVQHTLIDAREKGRRQKTNCSCRPAGRWLDAQWNSESQTRSRTLAKTHKDFTSLYFPFPSPDDFFPPLFFSSNFSLAIIFFPRLPLMTWPSWRRLCSPNDPFPLLSEWLHFFCWYSDFHTWSFNLTSHIGGLRYASRIGLMIFQEQPTESPLKSHVDVQCSLLK